VYLKRVLRRMFGPKREKAMGNWRRLHNEELQNLNASPNIIWLIKSRMRWEGQVALIFEMRNSSKILVPKHEGKIPLERPRNRWEDNNIRMDFREMGWEDVDWIHLNPTRNQTPVVQLIV
jgi:hypothetical protein